MKRWIVIGLVVISSFSAWAADRYVNLNNSTPIAPYTNWATAATDIQTAVNAALSGETVWVTNGHYELTSEILITNSITVQSINGPDVTIVDALWNSRCFHISGYDPGSGGDYFYPTSTISGFKIMNGFVYTDYDGGGVYCDDWEASTITNCIVTENIAVHSGGGVYGGNIYN